MASCHTLSIECQQPSEPGAALTAPALAHTCFGGASVSDRTCSIDGCAKPHYCRGWCAAHHHRWKRHGDPLGGRPTPPPPGEPKAFIERATKWQGDDCLLWPFSQTLGYGRVHIDGRMVMASRAVLERTVGPAPAAGMHAAHAPLVCHNTLCVNPRHLRWATAAENIADKKLDGTHQAGEKNPGATITKATADAIRAATGPQVQIAARFGVSPQVVSDIRTGKRWSYDHA